MPARPDHAILYDSDCGFCTRALDRVMRWDRHGRLRAVPIQSEEGDRLLDQIPPERRLDSWHLVPADGTVLSAGAAGAPLLRLLPGGALPAAVLTMLPATTEAGYRWVAAHREQLGRLFSLALVMVMVGCGGTVQDDSRLTVYLSAPLRGPDAGEGRELAAGARQALAEAGGEAAGVTVSLEVLDDTEREPAPEPIGWTQTRVAANARTATEDSTAIAYVGELDSGATRVSVPITNDAGVAQVAPGPVEPRLLAEPGGNDVPEEFQPSGDRNLVALPDPAGAPSPGRRGAYRERGFEAMALVLDAIGRAEDPLSRSDVTAALLTTVDRDSVLGSYSIDARGRASFVGS
jgi:predicted DCC family thiol-disulfide oxidoreductase YuxK